MKLKTLKPRLATLPMKLSTITPGSWRAGKQTSAQRGYGRKWREARAEHLSANPLCVYCEREGRVAAATVVDHKIPHRGDTELFWARSNWQSLCGPCHSGTKQREDAAM
jgi:5-methylcytosine-specific restriction endonuclease McrA